MKILVVDDSGGMRDLVRRAVASSNSGDHEFLEAANGVEALKEGSNRKARFGDQRLVYA